MTRMCRLFGFRSIFSSQVHSSLIGASNALMGQSEFHPDGWGVAYFLEQTPHIIKSPISAIDDSLFKKVSGVVSSQTVLAHIRKATKGINSILNCHPFQYGRWVFAHNGNIKNFSTYRSAIISKVSPKYRSYLLGETDSELLFFYIISHLDKYLEAKNQAPHSELQKLLQKSIEDLCQIIGPITKNEKAPNTETFLTFILTDGEQMIAFNGGQPLHYSTHKKKCPERDACSFFAHSCENKVDDGKVNHLIISSEPLNKENIWIKTKPGDLLYIDGMMSFTATRLKV